MPTGTALRDVRRQLFEAAERVLLQGGAEALTSRAVTTEAGCAKGVLHRHFADFDAFLAELVEEHLARLRAQSAELTAAAGTGSVTETVTAALTSALTPVPLALTSLIIFRDGLRARLRQAGHKGLPLPAETGRMIAGYLAREQELERLPAGLDAATVALTLVGTAHLLFAGDEGDPAAGLAKVVHGALARPAPPGSG
ncbi:TetR/AcrR family transcriptional regulator [Actinoplanes sp. RD1]|uniref:TetR/AcrR family transcriptional regulator n=1 Tax=Actinoplanes sp. RD1 TaxID=3064538 RepID=UPI0027421329|nr:TetR/AcrR family transcriptional regulator [Actinoplanes sp. RD1]